MLVLTRKRGEAIVVGENVRVTVIDVQGNRVRIGFEAPVEVRIRREELPEAGRDEAASCDVTLPQLACVTRMTGATARPVHLRRPRFSSKPR